MANEVAKAPKKQGIASYLNNDAVKANIMSVLGNKTKTATFITSVVSAVQTNPALAECTNASIMSGALLGESLKLSPSPQLGNYYLVPYKNKGVSEAQFQLGYKGMIQLAIRSGEYKNINVSEVKEGEITSYNPLTEEFVLNPCLDPEKRAKLKTVGYYAFFELNSGFRKEMYCSKEDMEKHAITYSKGYASDKKNKTAYTFWSKSFDDMAKKTMLRRLLSKWGVMSIDMQKAYAGDMAVIREDGSSDYVDNVEDPIEQRNEDIKSANTEEFIDGTAKEVG